MIRTLATAGVAVILGLGLADCSGGGGGSVTPNAPQPTNPVATATAPPTPQLPALVPLTVALTLPGSSAATSSAARAPEYVSPGTGSFSVVQTSLNGSPYAGTPTVAQVGSGANCTGTTTLVCTASLLVPFGTDGFTVSAFDGANGTGNVLSTGAATSVIALGFGNILNVTLDPVVASLAWVPTSGTCTVSTYCSNPLALLIEDAAGYQIVGSSPYVNASGTATPVTISVPGGMGLYSSGGGTGALNIASATQNNIGKIIETTAPAGTYHVVASAGSVSATYAMTVTAGIPVPSLNPNPVYVGLDQTGSVAVPSTTFIASAPGFSGNFAESDTCAGIASVSTASAAGPTATYTVTFIAGGTHSPSCSITIGDSAGNANVAVYSTSESLVVQARARK